MKKAKRGELAELSAEATGRLTHPHSSIRIGEHDWWLTAIQPIRRGDVPGIVAAGVDPYDRSHELVVLRAN
jgi:hypothetical protein